MPSGVIGNFGAIGNNNYKANGIFAGGCPKPHLTPGRRLTSPLWGA